MLQQDFLFPIATCVEKRAFNHNIFYEPIHLSTYDHRTLKIRLPVRSAIYKQCTGGLVVRWVTTSESPLLYVFVHHFFALVLLFAYLAAVVLNNSLRYLNLDILISSVYYGKSNVFLEKLAQNGQARQWVIVVQV